MLKTYNSNLKLTNQNIKKNINITIKNKFDKPMKEETSSMITIFFYIFKSPSPFFWI